ncbi:MAG TPA: hypothetical protein PKJ94_13380 [Ferruginibacter sp.]|nr:hypothetical protein [Ferruginibacter sp.]
MKRRTFLITTTAALAAASVPVVRYYSTRKKNYHPLIMPEELGNFCEEKAIREIGDQYRKMAPQESDKVKLEQLLLTDETGKTITRSDKEAVSLLMEKKTLDDFNNFRIHVLNGWVISVTEARQCALFSLT